MISNANPRTKVKRAEKHKAKLAAENFFLMSNAIIDFFGWYKLLSDGAVGRNGG
jgi:hypothetical protein